MATRRQAKKEGALTAPPLSKRSLLREAGVAQALREVAGALGAALELDELLELVLSKLRELVDAEQVFLFLLDEGGKEFVNHVTASSEALLRVPVGEGWLSHVARTGRCVRVAAESREAREVEWEASWGAPGRAFVLAPLKNNLSRTIGVLVAWNKRGETESFSADDEEITSILAKQAAIAIDNSRLLRTLIRKNQQLQQAQEKLTRRVRDLELLFELERATAHAHSHEELARAVLERLARACNAEGALLVLAEEGAHVGLEYALMRQPRLPGELREGEGIFRSAMVPRKESVLSPVLLSSAPHQMAEAEPVRCASSGEIRSLIGEPLEGETRPLGALGLINKRGGPFTGEDLELLRLVSANVSTAVRLFDTSRAREREERLSSIGRLLSQVIHDLKSPLTVISGYVQLMEEAAQKSDRQRYAEEILKQFQALGAMQREVLAFARGETRIFARKVLLDPFLVELKEQLDKELVGTAVHLELQAERKLVVHFDSERVTRAIQNLVRNSVEALGASGGVITIEARADGSALSLDVRDDGPGIPDEVIPHLFQSFVTAGKQDGTGLGLAIVKRIVEEHGGTIELRPAERGADFHIRLPAAVLRGASQKQVEEKGTSPRKKTARGQSRRGSKS